MSLADVIAAALWLGVCAYAVLGGADFGSGFWDLTAGRARRGAAPRALVDLAIGSVWEANHVWLIYCLVVLWTAFSGVFAAIMTTLWVPLVLASFGILLRGAGFAFRHATHGFRARRLFGIAFAASSVLTPFCMGAVAGGIASGRVPLDGYGDIWTSWLNPTSIFAGVLAVSTCAFLAATFLVNEAHARGSEVLERYFTVRGIGSGIVAGVLALVGVAIIHSDAEGFFDELIGGAVPVLAISTEIGGLGAILALVRRQPIWARGFAVLAVASVVAGWGIGQYPDMLPGEITIDQAAAPSASLWALVVVVVCAVLFIVPALLLLLHLSQAERLDDGQLDEVTAENRPADERPVRSRRLRSVAEPALCDLALSRRTWAEVGRTWADVGRGVVAARTLVCKDSATCLRCTARAVTRRGITALAVAAGLAIGAAALVPTAGADQVGDKQAEANRIADQLDALQARQQDLAAQGERVRYEQQQADKAVQDAQVLLDQTNADLEDRRQDVREVAVEAYEKGNDSPELDAFLTSDATSGVQKRTLLEARTSNITDTIDALGSAQQKAEDDKARLDEAQKVANAKAAEYESLDAANDKAVADAQALNNKVQGELQSLVQAERARRLEEQQRIAAQQTTAATAAAATGTQPTIGARTGGARTGGGGSAVIPSNPNPPPPGSGAGGAVPAAMTRNGMGPYVWGASGPSTFDCSGLVLWAYAQVGISLPHYSGAQYNATTRISRSQLQAGDLVFWGPGGSEHVAIYTGGGLIHAYGSGNGVHTTALEGWWKPPTGYGRVNG